MQTCSAQARGIDGHLFAVSATPTRPDEIHVAGGRGNVARHTATTVTHAVNPKHPPAPPSTSSAASAAASPAAA